MAVSTVKDSAERLSRWAQRNLANGVDHLVVFVDDSDPAGLAALAIDHVTPVDSRPWWAGARPERLNDRQRINANAVRAVGTLVPGVDWVVHLDGDEVAVIDRAPFDLLPADTGAVRLAPLEAVSRRSWPDDEPTEFKRLLTQPELDLLHALGGVAKAANSHYFHGHVGGKVAMRPVDGLWLGTHHVVDARREKQPAFEAPWLRLLHYESHTADEFVRKWTNLATSGGRVFTRGARTTLATAVRALFELDLPAQSRREVMLELFDRHVRDDVELLDRLGLLVRMAPVQGEHRPSVARGVVADLARRLHALEGVDKSSLAPGGDIEAARRLMATPRRRFLPRRA